MTHSLPPTDAPAPASAGGDIPLLPRADADPLAHLHKMSTTAGVGSQDYVAVNVTAVIAVLFGLASILAMIGFLLLVIPLVGIVLSLIALYQVRNSNGTQTGRGLAWLGLLLSAGISIGLFGYRGAQVIHRAQDERQIADVTQKFGQMLADRRFDDAYKLFDSTFHDRVPLSAFKIHLGSIQQGGYVPPIDGMQWNGLAVFQTDDNGVETAESVVKVHYKGMEDEDRQPARYEKSGDTWLIDNLPRMFPPLEKPLPADD